jgi:hypothetical protein
MSVCSLSLSQVIFSLSRIVIFILFFMKLSRHIIEIFHTGCSTFVQFPEMFVIITCANPLYYRVVIF